MKLLVRRLLFLDSVSLEVGGKHFFRNNRVLHLNSKLGEADIAV